MTSANGAFDITSTANERIKRLVRLQRRKHRDAEGVFVVEGTRLFDRAIDAGLIPIEVFVDRSLYPDWDDVVTVQPDVLDRASYRDRSEGLIAVFPQFEMTLDRVTPGKPPLILAVEGLEKPGNLGAVLRTADAVGADVVFTLGESIDLFNPNVLRASTGAAFTVPVVDADLFEVRDWLAANGIELITADPTAEEPYWRADLTGPVAILVGSEDHGLSIMARSLSGRSVWLPMFGTTDSLNASVALGVLAYEVVRQRSN